MEDLRIRRHFITDREWERTSSSWKELKPLKNFLEFKEDDETSLEYSRRLRSLGYTIPFPVIDQWLFLHYYNQQTVNNYGWIDFRSTHFSETFLSLDILAHLYIIEEYRPYVERRAQARVFDDFMCTPQDLVYWKNHHTWRVPPVVLDVASLVHKPRHAELGAKYQLIEGHTRVGYLYALHRAGALSADEYKVYLLSHHIASR